MEWLKVIGKVMNIVGNLVSTAEVVISGPGMGEKKKEMVQKNFKESALSIAAVSTGGQKETWTKLAEADNIIGTIIDTTVAGANLIGDLKDHIRFHPLVALIYTFRFGMTDS